MRTLIVSDLHLGSVSGSDVLRNFVIPIPVVARRYVRGIEFQPGNPRVLTIADR